MFRSKRTKRERVETSNHQSCSSQHVSSHDNSSQQLSRQQIQQSFSVPNTFMNDDSMHPNSSIKTSLLHNKVDNQSSLSFTQLLQSSLHTSLCTPHAASISSSQEPSFNLPNNCYSSRSPLATSRSASPSELETSNDQDGTNESRLMEEVEIVDNDGAVLRIQKMSLKDVYKVLRSGEKVLVHVNDLGQPINAGGGLRTRFMRLLLEQPNICPPDAKTFLEVKEFSGLRLLDELKENFTPMINFWKDLIWFSPHRVLQIINGKSLRVISNLRKQRNFRGEESLQEMHRFIHIQQILENKRDPYEVEFFDITYKTKSGSYVQSDSQDLMELAKQSVLEKIAAMTEPIDS